MFTANDFTLHIELGNAAMQTPDQVAAVLRIVADRLSNRGDFDDGYNGTIMDHLGNTVGNWTVEGEDGPMDEDDLFKAAHKLTGVWPTSVEEALEQFWGSGVANDEKGEVDGAGHIYRVEKWTVTTDSQGFSKVTEHGTIEEAEAAVEAFPVADED